MFMRMFWLTKAFLCGIQKSSFIEVFLPPDEVLYLFSFKKVQLPRVLHNCYNFGVYFYLLIRFNLFNKIFTCFRKVLIKNKKYLGLSFFTKQQKYAFSYKINLKNKTTKSKEAFLVFPIPASRPAGQAANIQKIRGETTFIPNDAETRKDEIYGNKYGIWMVKMAPRENKVFEMNFGVDVSPAPQSGKNIIQSFRGYTNISKDLHKFCVSNKYICVGDERIKAYAKIIRAGSDDVLEVMRRLNDFVITYLEYGNPISGLYTCPEALDKKHVDCGGFATLFASLAIAIGVPCRIVSGFWAGYKKSSMHAWVEFMLPDGNWIAADPSVEQLFRRGRTSKSGQFGFVGSDRIAFSYGCDIPIAVDGKMIYVDILQNPYLYPIENADGIEMEVECSSTKHKS